jgi:hypothetical protein
MAKEEKKANGGQKSEKSVPGNAPEADESFIEENLEEHSESMMGDFDVSDIPAATPDDDQVAERRNYYIFEKCKAWPVKGWLLKELLLNPRTVGTIIDTKTNPPTREKPNVGYLVLLTHPTKAYAKRKDAGGKENPILYNIPAGQTVIVPANAGLGNLHDKLAQTPSRVYSVFIQALEKQPHPQRRGQYLWRFNLRIGKSIDRASNPEFASTVGEPLLADFQLPDHIKKELGIGEPVYGGTVFPFGANTPQLPSGRA